MMTPQTMAVITRTFPAAQPGRAMALWGATAGVATLVGPVLGGVLVDHAGWEWIFFINVPVGIVRLRRGRSPGAQTGDPQPQLRLARRRAQRGGDVPASCSASRRASGMTGERSSGWVIGAAADRRGLVVGAVRLVAGAQQARAAGPAAACSATATSRCPTSASRRRCRSRSPRWRSRFMLWAQIVRGLDATPVGPAVRARWRLVTGVMAPVVGRLTDRVHPRMLTSIGFAVRARRAGAVWPACTDARRRPLGCCSR